MRLSTHYFDSYETHWDFLLSTVTCDIPHVLVILSYSSVVDDYLSVHIHDNITESEVESIFIGLRDVLVSIVGSIPLDSLTQVHSYLVGIAYTHDLPDSIFLAIREISQQIILERLSSITNLPILTEVTTESTGIISIDTDQLSVLFPFFTSISYWVVSSLPSLYLTYTEALEILPQYGSYITLAQNHNIFLKFCTLGTSSSTSISTFAQFNSDQIKSVTEIQVSVLEFLVLASATAVQDLANTFHAYFTIRTQNHVTVVSPMQLTYDSVYVQLDPSLYSLVTVSSQVLVKIVSAGITHAKVLQSVLQQISSFYITLLHQSSPNLFLLLKTPLPNLPSVSSPVLSSIIEEELHTTIHAILSVVTSSGVISSPVTVFYRQGIFYLIPPLIFQKTWNSISKVSLYYEFLKLTIKGVAHIVSHDFDEWRQFLPLWEFYEPQIKHLYSADFYWKRVIIKIHPLQIKIA